MKFYADLHLHSKYSRACSKNLDLENLNYWAKFKGLNLLATGDFTHPLWFKEIKEKLINNGFGFYKLKNSQDAIYFVLSCEISSIYTKNNKVRRIHYLVLFPNIEDVEKFNKKISIFGKLSIDGRPTLGIDIIEIIKIALDINENSIIIPAHIWTPWFSLFGSMSGFDSIDEALRDYKKYIYAIETGLSSDPPMNWRLSQLDDFQIVSFSDSHSPYTHRIGREATIFELENPSFYSLLESLKNPNEKNKIIMTVEFFPEEGKYHYDGHRNCRIRFSPEESKKNNYICPNCLKPVTVGVLSRVEKLADREKNFIPSNRPPFKHIIPLTEIIAQALKTEPSSKKVLEIYFKILKIYQTEFNFFFNPGNYEKLLNYIPQEVYDAIENFFKDKIYIEPGYDGEYGVVKIFKEEKEIKKKELKTLF